MSEEPKGPKRTILATAGGQLEWLVTVGEDVKEDQAVCLITSSPDHHIVRSRYTGTFVELVVDSKRYVNSGEILGWILQIEPVAKRSLIPSRPEPDHIPGLAPDNTKFGHGQPKRSTRIVIRAYRRSVKLGAFPGT